MTTTRSSRNSAANRRAAYKHVIDNVLCLVDTDPLAISLKKQKVNDILSLLAFSDAQIDGFTYMEPVGEGVQAETSVPVHQLNLLRILKAYNSYRQSIDPIAAWTDVTEDDFVEFRIVEYDPDVSYRPTSSIPLSSPRSGGSTPVPSKPKDTEAELFRTSIKKDKSQYPVLKEEKQWDSWYRSVKAMAKIHGCSNVLDTTYVPATTEELELFGEHQVFMYSVFDEKLQTDMGENTRQEV